MTLSLPLGEAAHPRLAYPHMMRIDSLIWTQFLVDDRFDLEQVWYDVKVGSPIEIPPDSSPQELAIAEGTGCKRIDVVAQTAGHLWIIEVKPYAGHVALGQVLTYVDLFHHKYTTSLPLQAVIICITIDPDLAGLFAAHHVRVEAVSKNPL